MEQMIYEKVDLSTLYPISLSSQMVERLLKKHREKEVSQLTKKEIVNEVSYFGSLSADGTIKLSLYTFADIGFISTSGVVLTHIMQDEEIAQRVLEKEMFNRAFEAYEQEQKEIQMARIHQIHQQMFNVVSPIKI